MHVADLDRTSIDHVLTTTRAVRRRLDLERPVPLDVVRECLEPLPRRPPRAGAGPRDPLPHHGSPTGP